MSVGKLTRYGIDYQNVVASGTATANVTTGRTIENIQLKLGGTSLTKAMLSEVKVKANGKVIMEGSGNQLNALNAYRGHTIDAAYLDLPFAERVAEQSKMDRIIGAFDTTGVGTLTTEVTIAGATAPTLRNVVHESAAQRDANGQPAGMAGVLAKVLRYPWNTSAGGKLQIPIPFGPNNGAIIKRLHVFHGGNMTGIEVKQDALTIHESLKADNEYEQKRWGRVPQTNCYTVDWILEGNMDRALNTRDARTIEILPTFSAADSGVVLVEYLDVLGNL